MNNGATLLGTINGGGSVNLLDYSDYTTAVYVNLIDGMATGISSLDSIQNIYGGSANDTLYGNNGENVIRGNGGNDILSGIDGDDTYLFTDGFGVDQITESTGVDTLDFSGVSTTLTFTLASSSVINDAFNRVTYNGNLIEHLIGGSADDTFYFADGFALPESGWINGSDGSDWLNYSAYTTGIVANLSTGAATGVEDGVINIENVIGGFGNDSITGSSVNNILRGGDGSDSLTGMEGDDTLEGGTGNDTYLFSGNAWGNDTLNDISGTDTLDFTGASDALSFNLGTASLTVSGGVNNLNVTSGNNIERLLGGTGDDVFIFANGAILAGGGTGTYLSGGSGNNTLDYTAYTGGVYVNLLTRTATGINNTLPGGIDHIQNVNGGLAYNEIWGDNTDNILTSGISNDNLYGLGGNDTYIFVDGWGTDFVYDTAGTDTLTFINLSTGVTFTFSIGSARVADGFGNVVTTDGNVENFTGTNSADTFIFKNGASISGIADGQGGQDTLDYSDYTSIRNVVLTDVGSVDGFKGIEASLSSFDNMDVLIGSGLSGDSLTGRNADATFLLGAAYQYLSINTLDFSGFENLNGGTAADTFIFAAGTVHTGKINGGGGTDTLDLSALTGRTVTLTGTGSTDGFNGLDVSVSGGFSNINTLVGTSGADMLVGAPVNGIFELDGSNRYYFGANSLGFSGFETLTGGSANDTFAFAGSYTFTGSLNGGAGTDSFDYSAYDTAITLNLQTGIISGLNGSFSGVEGIIGSASTLDTITGTNAGAVYNITGNGTGNINGSFSFSSVENLNGGSGTDTLNYSGYGAAITLNLETGIISGLNTFSGMETVAGSAFSDAILARTAGSSFIISGANSGTADGYTFTSFENLHGAGGADTFAFSGTGSLSGQITGGDGTDTLTYSAYTGPVTINLNTQTATGISGGFSGIETLIGSAASDALVGENSNSNFNITGSNSGAVSTYGFTSFENVTGGSGADTFSFNPGASISGALNGGSGTDWIDFRTYGAGVIVNLPAGTSTAVGGLISSIENIYGSILSDTLIGDNQPNMINAVGGMDTIQGNNGNDTFIFPAGSFFAGTLEGGAGTDSMDFSAYTSALDVIFSGLAATDGFNGTVNGSLFTNMESLTASGIGGDSLTGMNTASVWNISTQTYVSSRIFSYSGVENLHGGSSTDGFIFTDGASFNGTLDGGAGIDTLNFAAYTSARNIVLTDLGSIDGFNGTEASITGGFENMNGFTGSGATGDSLTGRNVPTTWAVDGSKVYINGTTTFTYAGTEILIGGIDADTFNISGNRTFTLRGGEGADVFNFANNAVLTGTLNGEGGADRLSFAAYSTARSVILTGAAVEGFAGNTTAITGGFSGIDELIGSAVGTTDTLTGMDADALFTIGAIHTVTVNSHVLTFSAFENLLGGTQNDTFAFTGSGTLTGSIQGGSGTDALNYAAYGSAVTINLETGSATGVGAGLAGKVSGIENLTGSPYDDTLTGDANDNVLTGLSGSDSLTGGLGDDTYIFGDGFGTDTVIETAGGGSDILDFSTITHSMEFTINAAGFSGGYGANQVISSGTNVENVIGGIVDDIFHFISNGIFNGQLDGGTGTDVLDYHLYSSEVTVNLFTGTATGTTGISGFENIIGSANADSLTGDDGNNEISGGAGDDTLSGLSGDDLYLFTDGYGTDTVIETVSGGDDTMDFTAVTHPLDLTFSLTDVHVTYDSNDAGHSGLNVEHILGTTAAVENTLIFLDATDVILTGLGTDQGFAGYFGASLIYFDNITALTGSASLTDSLTGMNAAALWNLATTIGGSYQSTNTLIFSGFETLYGGTKNDTFRVDEDVVFEGAVNGGTGTDTLDYSAYTGAVTVSLTLTPVCTLGGFSGTSTGYLSGFSEIDHLIGGSGLDSLHGTDSGGTFEFSSEDSYSETGQRITFAAFDLLNGGSGADTFSFVNGHGFSGSLDGETGDDTLTYAAFAADVSITLTGKGSLDGMSGTSTLLGGTFSNMNILIGGSGSTAGSDTLTGRDEDAVFEINTVTSYQVPADSSSVIFSGFNKLVGGNGKDRFKFVGSAVFKGDIDGSANTDLLDYSEYGTAVTVNLGSGVISGLDGTFTNLEGMIGSPFNDLLVGRIPGSVFHITGENAGDVDSNFTFESVETVQGGSAVDTLDYSLFAGPVDVVLTSSTADGYNGTGTNLGVGFIAIENIIGTASTSDTLTGMNGASTWVLDSAAGGTYNNIRTLNFTNFDHLKGGTAVDTFRVVEGVTFAGRVDGGEGEDILTYAGYITAVHVVITGLGSSDGYNGNANGLGFDPGFMNMNLFIGGTTALDSFTGANLDGSFVFVHGEPPIYNVETHSGILTSFEYLNGGNAVDTLDYSAYTASVNVNLMNGTATDVTGGISGFENIIGGSNNDTLTGDDLNNVITGNAGADILTGNGGDDILTGGAGADILTGNGGDDTFLFTNGWGAGNVVSGGDGEDTLDFSQVTSAIDLLVELDGTNTVSGSGNTVDFSGIDVVIGGEGDDIFNIHGVQDVTLFGTGGRDTFNFLAVSTVGGALIGSINGGSGSDVLNYQGDTTTLLTSRYFTLTGIGESGFNGTETSITGGFENIDEIVGGLGQDTLEGVNRNGTFNIHTASIDYTAGSTTLHLTHVENLVGGDLDDFFIFDDGAVLPGTANSIDGKAGLDTLDYSAYTTRLR